MPFQDYSIAIDGNKNIIIKYKNNSFTINTIDTDEVLKQLRQLNDAQIDSLLQIVDKQKEQLSEQFRTLLRGLAQEKNIVKGSISNVDLAAIGDNNVINYHIHYALPPLPKELTVNLPKVHPNDIVGREEDLKELYEKLSDEKRVVVVNGLGGIGKTTLAQVFVSKYYEKYEHIAWVTHSSESIIEDFIDEGGLVRTFSVDTANLNPEQAFEEVVRLLKTIKNKPNLLIIDNGENSLGCVDN